MNANPILSSLSAMCALIAAFAQPARGLEPWADQNLPVKDGLALWLDANREALACMAEKVKAPEMGAPSPMWHDASGNKRHARQDSPQAQAAWADFRTMTFAGEKHFVIKAPGWTMREATVFVVAQAMSNEGGYRALVSAGKSGANDYRTGFNLDLGSSPSDEWQDTLNAEGAGFRGERNLLKEPGSFGSRMIASLIIGSGDGGVKLFLDGREQNDRDRAAGAMLQCERFIVGARSYDNAGGPPTPRGFFHGNIFDVLVYDRVLQDGERRAVETYLAAKHVGVVYVKPAAPKKVAGSVPLVTIHDAPVIQSLVPGFFARRLPLQLTNINFLRYRPDGRLYAGAYDGKIYLLRDTDGDGLEDKAEVFWESKDLSVVMGMALTPPGYPLGEGVFVVTRGRVLLILDKDGDGRGDEVITVAEGWPPPQAAPGGVSDALGVALAPDGRVFFGLGANNFTNPYLLDARTGEAGYRVNSERGTIQEVSADFKRRTTVCTGLRFTVGLAFNRDGDLFATDQEGATWLANGNPFDELLHIQPGRHYGFPPRHPKHLPGVVDEPSTFDYGPQHQSTVGLCFDEPLANDGPIFGPMWWRGDALISAMSRGKIYRTKLVKTLAGYVAKNETIAQLSRINIDQAVSPRGTLTVTLHSGAPDWGKGPLGPGELWQIAPAPATMPQPALTWSASPTELRVAFDKPLPPDALATMQGKVTVTQGRYVQAGDRFEVMRPGYQAVKNQLAAPRFGVAVEKLALADADRTLVITTPARTAAANYGITIATDVFKIGNSTPHMGEMDLLADLTGLEAEWQPANGAAVKAWLPHPDFAVSREFTAAGGAQREFWESVAKDGSVTLRGQLDLGQMFQPAIQPGSKLDWEYPAEEVTVVLNATRPFKFTLGTSTVTSQSKSTLYEARQKVTAKSGTWLPLTVAFEHGGGDPALSASWFTAQSETPRAFALRRVLLPYAKAVEEAPVPHNENLPQLAGGNWQRGKALFYGQATCFVCHAMRGEGGRVGPDLTNLIYRDYDSVLRDIREPSATINPEYVGYTVTRKDGTELTAVLLAENATSITLGQAGGALIDVPRADISGMKQLGISLMPEGLEKALTHEQLRDLMTFLLVQPPAVPAGPPIEAVLLTGHDGPFHDWQKTSAALKEELEHDSRFHVRVVTDPEFLATKELFQSSVFIQDYVNWQRPGLSEAAKANLLKFVSDGGGLAVVHFANGAFIDTLPGAKGSDWPDYRRLLVRRAWDFAQGSTHDNYAPFRVTPTAYAHPITAGLVPFDTTDELYCKQIGDLPVEPLVTAQCKLTGKDEPLAFAYTHGQGRIFQCMLGHSEVSMHAAGELFRRGIAWAAGQEPVATPFEPAPIMLPDAPPPRKRAEVEAILGKALTVSAHGDVKPLHILLCASAKDAGHNQPGLHDYPLWRERWSRLLSFAKGVTVETADIWPSTEQWQHNDIVVFNSYNPAWASEKDPAKTAALANDLDTFLARGGGLVFLHYALNAGPNADALAARLGLAWRGGTSKFRHGASDWVLDKNHPLAAGFTEFKIPDESYWNLTGDLPTAGADTLATSIEENAQRPQMWTREAGKGRVFVSIPGHFTWTYDDPLYRILIFRGMMWTAHEPLDRLATLVFRGARVER